MKSLNMLCWEDDDFFSSHISILKEAISLFKKYKALYTCPLIYLKFSEFISYMKSFEVFMKNMPEITISAIFHKEYKLLTTGIKCVEIMTYKHYSKEELKEIQSLGFDVSKKSEIKLTEILKINDTIEPSKLKQFENIFFVSKSREFTSYQEEELLKISFDFEKVDDNIQQLMNS